ncbi:hypothetical protein [Mucilaginibacter sp. UYCu711]|uniref:hypothetical protein n=1 Tax=Mucilaginibacter sp. UYCu711 TaxID=3156339 RepID=UPI003D2516A5
MKPLIVILALSLLPAQSMFQSFKGCSLTGTITEMGTLYRSMDDPEIDRVTLEELRFLSASFLVKPAFFFYDDSEGNNAYSTPQTVKDAESVDGTVCFGVGLHRTQMKKSKGGTNIPIILAHEFAHTVARKYGLHLPTKQNELFADYLAGAYMFYRNQRFKPTDIDAAFNAFYSMGDNDFTNPDHHGTPGSRNTCIRQGFNVCQSAFKQGSVFTLNDVVQMGESFVTTHDLE